MPEQTSYEVVAMGTSEVVLQGWNADPNSTVFCGPQGTGAPAALLSSACTQGLCCFD